MPSNDPSSRLNRASEGRDSHELNVYVLAGGGLALLGLLRRSKFGLLMAAGGAGLAYRGRTGRWPFIRMHARPRALRGTVTINRPAEELYSLWSDLDRLHEYLPHIESIQTTDGDRSHWESQEPFDRHIAWDAEITEREPNRRIAWRSLRGGPLPMSGSVSFHEPPGGRGTEVSVDVRYEPPAMPLGAAVARVVSRIPEHQLRSDLTHLKQCLEAGEAPTTEGQPRGPFVPTTKERSLA